MCDWVPIVPDWVLCTLPVLTGDLLMVNESPLMVCQVLDIVLPCRFFVLGSEQ